MVNPVPLLSVSGLQINFCGGKEAPVRVVEGVHLTLQKGEVLALVGETGSGKTATSLALLQLLPSSPAQVVAGKAIFQSRQLGEVDLLQLPAKEMQKIRGREISMVFQEPMSALNPVMRCGKQVAEALQIHFNLSKTAARQQAIELLALVQLPNPEQKYQAYPHELSGGQKQRVMIAMALACNPSVLMADEPTTALDVTVQSAILDLLRTLCQQRQMAMLFVTHDLGVVAEIADRVAVLYQGKVVEEGTVKEVLQHPQHPYTKGLLACRPSLHTKSAILPTVADFLLSESAAEQVPEILGKDKQVKVNREELLQPVSQSQPPLIQVKDLRVHLPLGRNFFGRPRDVVKAVDGVSFEIHPGETVALVGESGCGKTTLGRALLRLLEPTAGTILLNGETWKNLSAAELRKRRKEFQIIFQDPLAALNPYTRIGEAIMEPMQAHGVLKSGRERKQHVEVLLQKVNLRPEHFHRYPHQLSGGQLQRINIARALALQPSCIVCDEAVSSLDASVQAQVLNLLNQLKQEFNMTYLFITHDLAVARFMADRIFVMHQGKIVEQGTAEQIFENPQHGYTKTLLQSVPGASVHDFLTP
ncbi:dipeptide ABC transporter ATP-binding protein [Nibribacter ruber]|uniref:Dipeptide ABC transporter ATP-binding protein n=1 Tax=Nibribacter ruber TaxID=2698458 RepID=A0A6P1P021_9BACT|nr:ABC transporter ATP-binding protein [Nibribacter ruber]QHL88164.1 dipeptide ABC transporter ATP-binding protein [Nibribacter ruber]